MILVKLKHRYHCNHEPTYFTTIIKQCCWLKRYLQTCSRSTNLLETRSKHPNFSLQHATRPFASHSRTRPRTSVLLALKNGAPWSNNSSFPSSATSLYELEMDIITKFLVIEKKKKLILNNLFPHSIYLQMKFQITSKSKAFSLRKW